MSAPNPDTNYFVCTLGQAALINQKEESHYEDVTGFIDHQARSCGKRPALGFAYPAKKEGQEASIQVFNFNNLRSGSIHAATSLCNELDKGSCVALLARSTAEFVFAWLGIIRAGHPVLLLAPQLHGTAIAHLCKVSNASALIYGEHYRDLAESAAHAFKCDAENKNSPFSLRKLDLDTTIDSFQKASDDADVSSPFEPAASSTDLAYLHHTSGTSSGLPKPIPQSHKGAVGVLPRGLDGTCQATFTTTPMYHGGPADCFRAWTANAMIWLFPGGGYPISASTVSQCLELIDTAGSAYPAVSYFSAVPYVLQMLSEDSKGLEHMKRMDLVGVGGAALPEETGQLLVNAGVHLVSRYGSAECGFLMSSHRPYDTDKEWQYLRSNTGAEALKFEQQDDGTFELIVLPQWPHRAKTNRPDGSFATSDLFARHDTIPNAWKYHSRADSQLTLLTGKKFDPAPLESSLGTHELLSDVVFFGEGMPFPGALLFRSTKSQSLSDEALVEQVAPMIEQMNEKSPPHARIGRNLLVPVPFGDSKLVKSSKGTLMRNKSCEAYGAEIKGAYDRLNSGVDQNTSDDQVTSSLQTALKTMLGRQHDFHVYEDLFDQGIDSLASIQLRHIVSKLVSNTKSKVPTGIVEDCGSIDELSQWVLSTRQGKTVEANDSNDELNLMRQLVDEYSQFRVSRDTTEVSNPDKQVIILTGTTGALGANVLEHYRRSSNVSKIICLLRGVDVHAATSRVGKALVQRGFVRLGDLPGDDRIKVLVCRLSDSQLGLDSTTYRGLANEATTVLHLAWAVNFRMRLQSFVKDHIAGLRNLMQLCLASDRRAPPVFGFCSSVASVSNLTRGDLAKEVVSNDPNDASTLGYSRSKWVAEQICSRAHENTALRDRIAVFRVGQLSGDSDTGVWNMKEAWPLMLSSVQQTKCLPDLKDEPLTWLAVDKAAVAMVEATDATASQTSQSGSVPILHIVNPHVETTWHDLLGWLHQSVEYTSVSPQQWLERLDACITKDPEHPAAALLGHWKSAYGETSGAPAAKGRVSFEVSNRTYEMAPTLRQVTAVDQVYAMRLWQWIKQQSQ